MDICILNSGMGSRLKKYTRQVPKGLVPLTDSETILGRQLSLLSSMGDFRYVITTGYLDGKIQDYVAANFPGLSVEYPVNTRYATTNYIASLELLASSKLDEIVLIHGDLIFERSVLEDILASRQSVVVIDSTLPLPEKDFKARIQDGKIIEIGLDVFGPDCHACQPLYHLMKPEWNLWQNSIHRFCLQGKESVYAENALNAVSAHMVLKPLDIRGRFCMEIDNEADLIEARLRLAETDA